MLYRLQRHALPIKAHFRTSLVLAYAVPAPILRPLLPAGLTLDTHGNFGFLAIALVETRDLRPSFIPAQLGTSFFLSGYRIFTRYRTTAGRTLRGLRILRSDTNRRSMQLFGNLLTHYHYERSQFRVQSTPQKYEVQVTTPDGRADLHVEADLSAQTVAPPAGSPFADLKEARKFAGPLPFTFDYDEYFDAVFDFGMLHHVVDWQAGVAEIQRVLKPSGLFFFEEVTRAALNRWIYRTFLDHPAENRFSEAEFLAELPLHGIEPLGRPRSILSNDIFIGIAKRTSN